MTASWKLKHESLPVINLLTVHYEVYIDLVGHKKIHIK